MSYRKQRMISTVLSFVILLSMISGLVIQPGLHLASAQDTTEDPAQNPVPEDVDPLTGTNSEPPDVEFPASALFHEDFQDADVSDWSLSDGWGLAEQGENIYLTATTPGETATINTDLWENVSITAWFGMDEGSTAAVSARVGDSAYTAQLNSAGVTTLYKGDELLIDGLTPTDGTSYHEPATGRIWYKVNVRAVDGDLSVSVNDEEQISYTDDEPLPAGWVVFSTGADNAGVVVLDNVIVEAVTPESDDPDGMTNTNPDVTDEPTTPDPITPTAEPETPENTVTPEPDDDETAPEGEIGDAVTSDDIEPTPVPLSLSEATGGKIGAALFNLLDAHTSGDEAAAYAIADEYFIEYNADGRLRLILWGIAGDLIAPQIQEAGGMVQRVASDHVEAYVSPQDLINITQNENIFAITVPDAVVSTSDNQSEVAAPAQQGVGTVLPHSMDILGVNSWHLAGYQGGSVNIAVIDVGFTGGSAAERTCLGSSAVEGGAGSSSHGMEMVEVICDLAPLSAVWMYSASTVADVELAVQKAARLNATIPDNNFPKADVIVIATDTGLNTSFLPTVDEAVVNNIPVIVPAGNNGNNGALSLMFNGGESNVTVIASAGSILSYAWQETNGPTNYPTALMQDDQVLDSRPVRTGQANHQYVIPASCGESCVLTLEIAGETATTFDVQITGAEFDALYPDGTFTPLASGSLTELASLDSVISVGAVCAWQEGDGLTIDRYQILPDSSTGDPGQQNNNRIKPSVVAPARVATSITPVEPECAGGFGQTSAAAAHVAGIAALLLSNENMQGIANAEAGVPEALRAYLQSRSIDLYVGATADGFDNVYGAGLIQLGNPEFNLGLQQTIGAEASEIPSGAVYVDSSRIYNSGEPDGSIARPYINPAQAVQEAVDQLRTNVVFLPGEYVTSFEVPNPDGASGGLTITSYDYVDASSWFPSQVWVNDTFDGVAGIRLDGVDRVTIQGLNFTGSTPLYEAVLPEGESSPSLQISKLTPFDVTASDNVTVRDNTFINFDAPIIIEASENVEIQGNTFENFEIATTTTFIDFSEVEIPLYETTVFDIQDSGQTNKVVLEFNLFQNNTIPITVGAQQSTIQEPIVRVLRSQVDIRSSLFVTNSSESVIAINQWEDGAETAGAKPPDSIVDAPVTIFSTVFDDNTVDSSLIQVYQAPEFRFINNTVVGHVLNNEEVGHIIGIGHLTTDRLSVVDHRFELHNNIFYNNIVASFLGTNFPDSLGSDGCLPVGGVVGQPRNAARYNWFAPSFSGGECSESIGTPQAPANNNIYTEQWEGVPLIAEEEFQSGGDDSNLGDDDPQPPDPPPEFVPFTAAESAAARAAFEEYHFFTAVNDPDHPWRLRPTPDELADPPPDPINYNPGVETGDVTLAEAIPGLAIPFFDPRRNPRPVNRPPTIGPDIDRGAYELGDPSPIMFVGDGNINLTVQEDTTVLINLKPLISGGFEPYRFEVENLPTVFDTNPLNACGGEPYRIQPVTYIFTYCPPPDFHNAGLTPTFPQGEIRFSYEVFGLLTPSGEGTGQAEILVNIVSVPESEPLLPDKQYDFLIDPTAPFSAMLQPNATFNADGNFVLSDPDASVFSQSPDVDFIFSYSDVAIDTSAPLFNPQLFDIDFPEDPAQLLPEEIDAINTTLNNAIGADNIIRLYSETPGVGWTPELGETGAVEFTYDVTDSDGDVGERRMRIRIVEKLGGANPGDEPGDTGDTGTIGPGDPPDGGGAGSGLNNQIEHLGLHDDSSLDFNYSEGWLPFYYGPAVNETLHYNTDGNQSFTFSFGGDGFALRWLSYQGAGSYQLEIDHDDDGVFTPYNEPSLALTCTGDFSGNTISTSRTTVHFSSFGCSGLELTAPGQLHTIRVTTTSATPIWIDAIEVREEGLLPGYYQADDFAIRPSEGWTNPGPFAGPAGDTLLYTNQTDQTLRFTVDGTLVDSIVVYRTTGALWGTFDIRFNGQVANSVNSTGDLGAEGEIINYWTQAAAATGIGNGLVEVEIRTTGTDYVGIEAIELLSTRKALETGYHPLYDSRIRAGGAWGLYAPDPESRSGGTYYNAQPDGGSIIFAVSGRTTESIVLHHSVWGGSIQVCGRTCADVVEHSDPNMRYTSIPVSALGLSGATENVVVNVTDFYVGLESIEVVESSTLQPGYYDQIRDAYGITYTGVNGPDGWYHVFGVSAPGARDGSASWARNTTESMGFDVPAGIDGLVIYHADSGTIQVCADDGTETCANIAAGTSFAYGGRAFITAEQLGLDPLLGASIIISPADASWIGLEGIQVVGAPEDTPFGTLTKTRVNPSNAVFRYVDDWGVWRPLEADTDEVYYTLAPHAGVFFKFEGAGLDIGYVSGLGTGNFEVCIDAATCTTVNAGSTAATIEFDNVTTIDAGSDGLHVAEIRSLDAGWIGLTSIGVSRPRNPLGVGFFNDGDADLNFNGAWTALVANDVKGGTYKYATGSTNALTFTVDTSEGGRVVIYHPNIAGWGQMQVCVDDTCANYPQANATRRYTGVDLPVGGISEVSISPASGWIGVEGIEVYPTTDGRGLGPGFYDDKDVFLNYSGNWFTFESFAYKGGSVAWSDSTGTISFNVDATRTQSIAIHHPAAPGWGQIRVCGGAGACQNINLATASSLVTDIPATGENSLSLEGTSAQVTIEWLSGFGGFDGVEVVGTSGSMGPGYHEEDSVSVTQAGGSWLEVAGPYSGGIAIWSESPDAAVSFSIGGGDLGLDRPVTGFTTYFARYFGAAEIEVCITRQSNAREICTAETTSNNTGAFEPIYGISFLGLPQYTTDGTAIERYDVTITKTGGGWLGVDAVAVHGDFRDRLRQGENFRPQAYDDSDFNIVYGPEPLWGSSSFVNSGLFKNTVAWTGNAGALAQVAMRGNSLTMFQIPFNGASDEVRFCLVVGTSTNSGVQCSNYSLNDFFSTAPAQSAITLYGFGFGNHELYIENRDHLGFLAIDAIQVR